ncbi:hypothetical protein CYMTET_6528 [Cymbomonas tetramitiformis]|uniref:Uncharacterized protein n=1 Tax=Cymbomonas tetramitiformis TaxID=36881 RepID=A0AAE0GX81_9CHLO|nr:hypothetical protein CYMTET_6528 [Cymbomonas tetramitiformis]
MGGGGEEVGMVAADGGGDGGGGMEEVAMEVAKRLAKTKFRRSFWVASHIGATGMTTLGSGSSITITICGKDGVTVKETFKSTAIEKDVVSSFWVAGHVGTAIVTTLCNVLSFVNLPVCEKEAAVKETFKSTTIMGVVVNGIAVHDVVQGF